MVQGLLELVVGTRWEVMSSSWKEADLIRKYEETDYKKGSWWLEQIYGQVIFAESAASFMRRLDSFYGQGCKLELV